MTTLSAGAAVRMSTELVVVEGIDGAWHYHLAQRRKGYIRALCGAATIPTELRAACWGVTSGHLSEVYCRGCENLAGILLQEHER